MADISQIKTPDGEVYNIKDTVARSASGDLSKIESGMAIIVDGDTCTISVPAGGYAYIKNNTHSLAEGLYMNKSSSAFPTSGGTADSTVFELMSSGGLNSIAENIASLTTPTDISSDISIVSSRISEIYTKKVHKINKLIVVQLNGKGSSSVGTDEDIFTGFPKPNHQISFSFTAGTTACRGKILANTAKIRLDSSDIKSKFFNISFCYVIP